MLNRFRLITYSSKTIFVNFEIFSWSLQEQIKVKVPFRELATKTSAPVRHCDITDLVYLGRCSSAKVVEIYYVQSFRIQYLLHLRSQSRRHRNLRDCEPGRNFVAMPSPMLFLLVLRQWSEWRYDKNGTDSSRKHHLVWELQCSIASSFIFCVFLAITAW